MPRFYWLLVLTSATAFSQTPQFRDVNYAGTQNIRQNLDIYLPAGNGPFPLVIWVHGGGWLSGSKEGADGTPAFLLPRGIAVAAINYRYSTQAQFPAQIQDVKAAIRFLRANATQYRLDATRFAIAGGSSGGHLAALAAMTGGVTRWNTSDMPNPSQSDRVLGVVDLFGPTQFQASSEPTPTDCGPNIELGVLLAASALLGCPLNLCSTARINEANPIAYIDADDPPALILHGTSDCTVPMEQSRLFAEALRRNGKQVIFRLLPNAGHGAAGFDAAPITTLMADFAERIFAGNIRSASAADFEMAQIVPNQMVTTFGQDFVAATVTAPTLPLPETLGGIRAEITPPSGAPVATGIVSVAPTQVSFVTPRTLASGAGTLRITRNGTVINTESIRISQSMPSLFTAIVDGVDYPRGYAVYNDASGRQQRRAITEFVNGAWRANPIPFSTANGPVTLELYGTGLNSAPQTCAATVFDRNVAVKYAGPQGEYPGFDQYNVEISRSVVQRDVNTLAIQCGGVPVTPIRFRAE